MFMSSNVRQIEDKRAVSKIYTEIIIRFNLHDYTHSGMTSDLEQFSYFDYAAVS